MAIRVSDQRQIGWFVKATFDKLSLYLNEEVTNQPEYQKLNDYAIQVYKDVEQVVQDKLGPKSWRSNYTSNCVFDGIPGCNLLVDSSVPQAGYLKENPLSDEERSKLISMYADIGRLNNIQKIVVDIHYRNYTDLALEIPFIESLSDAGKIPINTKEYKTIKDFKPEPLVSKEDNMFLQSIIFRAQLARKELPRIKSFKPFQFR